MVLTLINTVFAQDSQEAGIALLSSIGIAVINVINGGKNDLRRNGLAR
jgi:hypothetical protein